MVVVQPGEGGCAAGPGLHTGLAGNLDELAVTLVVKQRNAVQKAHCKIDAAVVVVIGGSAGDAGPRLGVGGARCQANIRGYIVEFAARIA